MSRPDPMVEAADRQIKQSLADAAARMGYKYEPAEMLTPAAALMRQEEGDEHGVDEWPIRIETVNALMGLFFGKGPDPRDVMVQVFAFAKTYRPDLLLNMTCQDLANMFGDTKAAWSWRCKHFSRMLARSGARGTSTGFQKSPSSSRTFAAAQKGNTNRRGKKQSSRKP